jgi:acetyl esterase/lipase
MGCLIYRLPKPVPLLLGWLLFTSYATGNETAKQRADRVYAGYPTIIRDLQYKSVDGFEDIEQLSMDLILPVKKVYPSGAPVVMYIHGGGWSGGERYVLDPATFRPFTDQGIAVACISYRLARDGSSALECLIDCKDAARFLAKNAATYELDPARFAAIGHSAGGHLALSVALVPPESPLLRGDHSLTRHAPVFVCAVGLAPLTTLLHPEQADETGTLTNRHGALEKIIGGKSGNPSPPLDLLQNDARERFIASIQSKAPPSQVALLLSPEFWIEPESPPVLIAHGSEDPLISVRGARYFTQRAKQLGANVTYIECKGAGHDLRPTGQRPSSPSLEDVEHQSRIFLIEQLLQGISP